MYFTSDMPGGEGGSDILYEQKRKRTVEQGSESWQDDHTPYNESFPMLWKDSLLYFSSEGHFGQADWMYFTVKMETEAGQEHRTWVIHLTAATMTLKHMNADGTEGL